MSAAQVAPTDAPTALTYSRTDGSFMVAPIYGWHGAYALGGVGVSLLPGFDMPSPSRSITVSARGYRTSTLAATTGTASEDYIRVGDILLKRQ